MGQDLTGARIGDLQGKAEREESEQQITRGKSIREIVND
jgi:hypothetical protein